MSKVVLFLVMLLLPLSPFSAEAFSLGIGAKTISKHLPGIIDFGVCGVLKLFNSSCPQSINDFRSSQNLPDDISAGTLLLNFSIGDARQKVSLIADTTTDLTFMLCQPCRDCAVEANIAVYNSSRSETFSKYTCQGSTECLGSRYTVCSRESCTYYYADYPYVSSNGFLAKDTFLLSDDNPVAVVFGCGRENTGNFGNSVGYVGLGLGNLSFVSQLNVSVFSYCFSSFPSESAVFFGSDVRLHDSALSSSTKLLPNLIDPTLYYVNMTGITVGKKRVEILTTAYLPQPDGTGGMIVDSVSSVTLLEESVYLAMKQEFINQVKLPQADASPYGLDLCFKICPEEQDIDVPDLTVHFAGGDLNPSNYFLKDADGGALCLMVLPTKGISVLGNLMQVNLHMVFDIGNSVLKFESVNCGSLRS